MDEVERVFRATLSNYSDDPVEALHCLMIEDVDFIKKYAELYSVYKNTEFQLLNHLES